MFADLAQRVQNVRGSRANEEIRENEELRYSIGGSLR